MRVLLTGFEPFNNSPINPSQEVVQRLTNCPPDGIELYPAILPVEHRRGPQALLRALGESQPEAVVCLGEAGSVGICIERVAINLIDDTIPDNAGECWVDQPVVPGGPAAYFTTLPVKVMQQAILEAGVPVDLSLSAGAFLCNQIAYTLLHYLASRQAAGDIAADINIPAGFIHLPRLPEQAAARKLAQPNMSVQPSMSLEMQVRGLVAALQELAGATSIGEI
jgi:pyroglutamyl-peptidase